MSPKMQELLEKTGKGLGPQKSRLARHIVVLLGYVFLMEGIAIKAGDHSPGQGVHQLQGMSSCLKELAVHIGLSEEAFDEVLKQVAREVESMFMVAEAQA